MTMSLEWPDGVGRVGSLRGTWGANRRQWKWANGRTWLRTRIGRRGLRWGWYWQVSGSSQRVTTGNLQARMITWFRPWMGRVRWGCRWQSRGWCWIGIWNNKIEGITENKKKIYQKLYYDWDPLTNVSGHQANSSLFFEKYPVFRPHRSKTYPKSWIKKFSWRKKIILRDQTNKFGEDRMTHYKFIKNSKTCWSN